MFSVDSFSDAGWVGMGEGNSWWRRVLDPKICLFLDKYLLRTSLLPLQVLLPANCWHR